MLKVQLVKTTNFEGFTKIQETVNEKGVHNVLLITDSEDTKKYWESKNVRVELILSIDDNVINQLSPSYKTVDTIIITSPKLITRYFNETVNVKLIKAKELFQDFTSTIYILTDYAHAASMVSNSKATDSRRQQQGRSIKVKASAVRGIGRLK